MKIIIGDPKEIAAYELALKDGARDISISMRANLEPANPYEKAQKRIFKKCQSSENSHS